MGRVRGIETKEKERGVWVKGEKLLNREKRRIFVFFFWFILAVHMYFRINLKSNKLINCTYVSKILMFVDPSVYVIELM